MILSFLTERPFCDNIEIGSDNDTGKSTSLRWRTLTEEAEFGEEDYKRVICYSIPFRLW